MSSFVCLGNGRLLENINEGVAYLGVTSVKISKHYISNYIVITWEQIYNNSDTPHIKTELHEVTGCQHVSKTLNH